MTHHKQAGSAPKSAVLPAVGMSRWDTIQNFVPISRESWRKLVNAGKAPKPVRLSERCTMYSNAEVHRWLADPTGYRA
jgi:prophage regulatory protein